jgi:hypothetical protein
LLNSQSPNIKDIIKTIAKPPQVYSWQTFILLSIFSFSTAIVSFLINYSNGITEINNVQNFITNSGFFFFIIGISWVWVEQAWRLRAWLISGLICLFLFANLSFLLPHWSFILFPILAALISIFPDLIDQQFKLKLVPEKQHLKIILTLGIHLMLSCWIQVYFMLSNWTLQYPTILADDLTKSSIIINLNPASEPRGIYWLEQIKFLLKTQLNNKQWLVNLQWLEAMKAETRINQLKQQIISKDKPILEDNFWKISLEYKPVSSGYTLKITAIWQGPKAKKDPYFCQTTCLLQPLFYAEDEPEITTSQFNCNPTVIKGWKN